MQYLDFTDMPVWQQSNLVVQGVYQLCLKLPRSEDYALSSQLKRASLSITANIAEGFGRSHARDKAHFYLYARGSAFEVRSHLLIAKDLNFFTFSEIEQIDILCKQIIEALNKLVKGLSTSKAKSQP